MIRTAIIIIAIVIVAAIQGYLLNESKIATENRDHQVITSQQQIITTLANATMLTNRTLTELDNQVTANMLYHGALMYMLDNNRNLGTNISQKLDNLIAAHNEMIQAIENATGHHTPIINNIKNVHNTYCTIYVVKPECKKTGHHN